MRVDALGVETEDHSQADEVQEGEGEETHVDPLAEALPEEHRHVDDVGRDPDDVEDRDEDGGYESVNEKLRLLADEVPRVVPWDNGVHTQDDAVLWDTVH